VTELGGEVLQQNETGEIGPVKIVEGDGDRNVLGQCLEQAGHRPEQPLLRALVI
jgi:hypothetical protein